MTWLGVASTSARVGTKAPFDFAYWASTYASLGKPEDYSDIGPEIDGVSLVSWAASQVGVEFPSEYVPALFALEGYQITTAEALSTRGAVLISPTQIAVSMGLSYIVGIINGRYFQHKVGTNLPYQDDWYHGAKLPGLEY